MSLSVNTPLLHEVECGCIRCGRPFGPYYLAPMPDGRGRVPIDWARPADDDRPRRPARGPRTGMRLSIETFDRRVYLRILCKCGRNEKLGREELDRRMFDRRLFVDGILRLRDGVLYL